MIESSKSKKLSTRRLVVVLCIFLILAVLIEAAMSLVILRYDLRQSSEVFLNQIENVIKTNEEQERNQLEELKETYMTAAKAATYIVSSKEYIKHDVNETKKIASILNVDELFYFDKTGTIIGGTNPNYYGYSFDSGEQMGFFKPMLLDKSLSMCQDVTPNTAEGKKMMYAITWDDSGEYMVQVGVEPMRLLDLLKNHEIENVLNNIPLTEGYNIYVLNKESNSIIASSNEKVVNKSLPDDLNVNWEETTSKQGRIKYYLGEWYFVNNRKIGDNSIMVSYNLRYSNNNLIFPIITIFVYLLLSIVVITLIIVKARSIEKKKNATIMEQFKLLSSVADIYYSMHLVDLENDTSEEIKSQGYVKQIVNKNTEATKLMRQAMKVTTSEEYVERALEFTELTTLAERMGDRKVISTEFAGRTIGWFQGSFIEVERNAEGKLIKVIWATRNIDEMKKREEKLIFKSHTDELTGCFNRRAYEDSIKEITEQALSKDFVYLSIDLNGLKAINDTLGHEAGDELIVGAGKCLQNALSSYGKVFRTGGDEFVAFLWTGEKPIEDVLSNLNSVIDNWRGKLVDSLSLSYGCVLRLEYPDLSLHDMAILADKKMYESKSLHYRLKGIDRRGQQDAHKALTDLYSKIVRANLKNDSYQIISMDSSEQTSKQGFTVRISEWLTGFGKSGKVHQDNVEEYLKYTDIEFMRNYFAENKEPIRLFYKRLSGEEYKNAMMEIVPANDYSDENQNVFINMRYL